MVYYRLTEESRDLAENFIEDSFGIEKDEKIPGNAEIIVMTDEQTDDVLGIMAIELTEGAVLLKNMVVKDGYRRKGYGTEMMDELKLILLQNDIRLAMIHMSVPYADGDEGLAGIEGLISFFEKQGFWINRTTDTDDLDRENRVAVGIMEIK